MQSEYNQYVIWHDLACRCICRWSEGTQDWFAFSFHDLLGHGTVDVFQELPEGVQVTTYELVVLESTDFSVSKDENRLYLSMNASDLTQSEAIQCMLTDIFQYEYKKKGYVTLHSGAYHLNHQNVLLVGESGAGKTTLLVNGKSRIPNFEIMANDFSVLSPGETVTFLHGDSTSSVSIRKDIMSQRDLKGQPDKYLGSENRNYIQLGQEKEFASLQVDKLLFIELSDVRKALEIVPMTVDEICDRLYYSTVGLDSGLQLMIFNKEGEFQDIVPNLMDASMVEHAYQQIKVLLNHVQILRVVGCLDEFMAFIEGGCQYHDTV